MLRKYPGFTLVTVFILSMGISVSIAMFGLLDWVSHPDSPFPDSEQIVHLVVKSETEDRQELSYLDVLTLREQLTSVSDLAAYGGWNMAWKGKFGTREIEAKYVTRNFFSVSGIQAHLGTLFTDVDAKELKDLSCVVLSYRFWKSYFGSDPTIVGQPIFLDDDQRTIVGVAPESFYSFEEHSSADIWICLTSSEEPDEDHFAYMIGRLAPGASVQVLQTEAKAVFERLNLRHPDTQTPLIPRIKSDYDQRSTDVWSDGGIFMMGLAWSVLLIACLNVSGLLLAKANIRHTEMAVRQALGGSRVRLMRQLFTEGVILSVLALVCSLFIAHWLMHLVKSFIPAEFADPWRIRFFNPRIIGFSLSITLIGSFIFEWFPIRHICKMDLIPALKADRSRYSGTKCRLFGLNMLVVSQLAVALVLTVNSALMLRSFQKAGSVDLGFERKDVLVMQFQPDKDLDSNQIKTFYRDLVTHVRTVAGVNHVSLAISSPCDRNVDECRVSFPSDEKNSDSLFQTIQYNMVSSGYFQTLHIPVLKGRTFHEPGGLSKSTEVVVSENFASRFWPDLDPIGRFIQLDYSDGRDLNSISIAQVVGMVGNVMNPRNRQKSAPYFYIPMDRTRTHSMTLLVETQAHPLVQEKPLRQIIQRLNIKTTVLHVTTLAEQVRMRVLGGDYSIFLNIFGTLSLIGMGLASIGLYSIIAFTVSRQTHELGIRLALGAGYPNILRTIMKKGVILTLIGLCVGLAGSFLLSLILRTSLFGISPFDVVAYLGSAIVLAIAAMLACYIPARRAARIDPMVALRYE
jgi:putative ABC transport system permease protein